MAITQAELDRVRLHLETKITSVTVEHVSMAQAIGSYGERFTGVEARIDAVNLRLDALSADIDRRFDAIAADMDRRFSTIAADTERAFSAVSADMDRRFDAVDRRFTDVQADIGRLDARIDRLDSKLDARFNIQTLLMTVLGMLVLFGESLRAILGL